MNAPPDAVRCLVLPVSDDQVLVPSAVVAEVFAAREIPPLDAGPRWLLGRVGWRESTLAVVCIEAAVGGERPPIDKRAKIVVLRVLGDAKALTHYAMLVQGIPKQVIASPQTVQAATPGAERPFVASEVSLEGERAFIPDLDALERALVALAPSWQQPEPTAAAAGPGAEDGNGDGL